MADAKTSIIISAVDQTKAACTSARRNLSDLATTGDKLAGSLGGAGRALAGMTGLGGLGALVTGGGLIAMTKQVADQADALGKLSQKTGVAVEDLSRLQYAASLSDVSNEQLEGGLAKLAKGMADAAAGTGEAKAGFDALGLTQDIQRGKFKNAGELFAEVADRMSRYADGANKSAIAQKLFGDAGAQLIPLLDSGAGGLREMADESDRLGKTMSTDLANASQEFNDNLTRLQTAADGAKIALGTALLPAISDVVEEMVEGIKQAGGFADALLLFGLRTDPFKSLGENLSTVRDQIAETQAAIDRMKSGGKIYDFGPKGTLFLGDAEKRLSDLKKQLGFLEFQERRDALAGNGDVRDPRDRKATGSPSAAPSAPGLPVVGKPNKDDPLGDFAKDAIARVAPAEAALKSLRDVQLDAAVSGADLTRSERAFYDLINSDAWASMSDPYKSLVRAQFDSAEAAEKAAVDQKRLNDLVAATPTAQLEKQRDAMQFLADAFGAGKISADQFSEAANAALGNVGKQVDDTKDLFAELKDAIEGWGKDSAAAIVDFALKGKSSFGDMIDSMLADVARMVVYQNVTKPAANYLNSVNWAELAANIFGGGRASGGPVGSGRLYEVAEGGAPELLTTGGRTYLMMGQQGGYVSPAVTGAAGAPAAAAAPKVTVTVVNQGGSQVESQSKASVGADGSVNVEVMLYERVKGRLIRDTQQGGGLAPLLEAKYGLNPAAGARR